MTPGGMNGSSNFAYLNTKIQFDPEANRDPFRASYSQNNFNQSSNIDDFNGTPHNPNNANTMRSSMNSPNFMRNSINYNGIETEEEDFQGDCAVSLWDPSQVKKWLIFCHLGEFAGKHSIQMFEYRIFHFTSFKYIELLLMTSGNFFWYSFFIYFTFF